MKVALFSVSNPYKYLGRKFRINKVAGLLTLFSLHAQIHIVAE